MSRRLRAGALRGVMEIATAAHRASRGSRAVRNARRSRSDAHAAAARHQSHPRRPRAGRCGRHPRAVVARGAVAQRRTARDPAPDRRVARDARARAAVPGSAVAVAAWRTIRIAGEAAGGEDSPATESPARVRERRSSGTRARGRTYLLGRAGRVVLVGRTAGEDGYDRGPSTDRPFVGGWCARAYPAYSARAEGLTVGEPGAFPRAPSSKSRVAPPPCSARFRQGRKDPVRSDERTRVPGHRSAVRSGRLDGRDLGADDCRRPRIGDEGFRTGARRRARVAGDGYAVARQTNPDADHRHDDRLSAIQ